MKRLLLSLAFLAFVTTPATAGRTSDPITAGKLQAHIDFLASDLLEGRDSGHRGARLAARYIQTCLERAGFQPLFDDYQMEFEIRGAQGPGRAVLSCGEIVEVDPEQLEVPDFSAATRVAGEAGLAEGKIDKRIVVTLGGRDDEADRETATRLMQAGAAGVVLVSASEVFSVKPQRDRRRMGVGRTTPARQGGGLPFHVHELFDTETGTLSIPVVRASRMLGAALVEAAEAGKQISLQISREGVNRTSNVIGWIKGSDPTLASEYVVAGAHYDHVGHDDLGNIWNGADDNASGTAAILEFAATIGAMDRPPRRSILLCLWSAEERGLLGSKAFAKVTPVPFEQMAAYINLDMISRNDPEFLDVCHASDDLFEQMKAAAGRHGLEVNEGAAGFLNASDTQAFMRAKVPTAFPFTNTHGDYHKASDDPHTVDADKAMRVARTAFEVLLDVANADGRPTFKQPALRGGRAPTGRRLGVMTGGTEDGTIRISAVTNGSVAARAGMKVGDVIVRIGEDKLGGSVMALRSALKKPKKDASFEIEVLRDGASLVLSGEFKQD